MIAGRKGISPLIAAVMLLVFVMAVGGLVSQWSGTLVKDSIDENTEEKDKLIDCSKMSLEFVDMTEDYSNNYLNLTVKSVGGGVGNVSVRAHPSYIREFTNFSSGSQVNTVSLNVDSPQDRIVLSGIDCDIERSEELE